MMFSATFPREIQQLAQDFLDDNLFITVGRVGSTTSNIRQSFIYLEDDQKRESLLDLLYQEKGQTLIFVDTKRTADAIDSYLYDRGFLVEAIHGDRSQEQRERALERFKSLFFPLSFDISLFICRMIGIPLSLHITFFISLSNSTRIFLNIIDCLLHLNPSFIITNMFLLTPFKQKSPYQYPRCHGRSFSWIGHSRCLPRH